MFWRYSQEVGGIFNLEHYWQVVKDSPQWTTVPTMSSDAQNTPTSRASTRSKTSKSSEAHFIVDDEQETRREIQGPRRPIGRNKAKNASTSNTTGSNLNDKFNCLLSEIKGSKISTMLPMSTE